MSIDLSSVAHRGIVGTSVVDDDVALVKVNEAFRDHGPGSQFDHAVVLTVPIVELNPDDPPGEKAKALLDALESDIDRLTQRSPASVLAASVTFATRRQCLYLFYARSPHEAAAWCATLRATLEPREVSTEVVVDPRWRIYDDYLGSARQGHEDRSVLRILQEHEVDVREPRRIEHRLHFPTNQAATEADRALRVAGFEEIEPASFPEGRWSLVVSVVDAPMPVPVARRRAWFSAFCAAMGGEYDGWGTRIEPSRRKRRQGAL